VAPVPVSLSKARLLVSLAILSALVGSTAPSPLYGIYQATLQFSSTTLTTLFAVYAIGVLLALGVLGKLSDRLHDRRFIIVPALAVVALGCMVFACSTELPGLFAGRFLAGVGTGALTGSANATLVGFDARDGKSHAAVLATVSFTLGAALGPVLSSAALGLDFHPTITPFILNASLAGCTAIGLCLVPWNSPAGPRVVLGNGAPSSASLKKDMQGAWKAFGRICCILVVAWSVGSVFVALGPSMLINTMGAASAGGHASAGLLVTGFQATAGITQFLFRRALPERAMKVGGFLITASWFGCLIALHLNQPLAFVACSVVAGIGYGASFVGAMGVFTSLAPTAHRAALGSLFYLAGYLGSAICIIAMGAAVDLLGTTGASALMLLVVGLSLAGVLLRRR
jgi:MFS family permease